MERLWTVNAKLLANTKNFQMSSIWDWQRQNLFIPDLSVVFDGKWPFRMSLKTWSDSTKQASYFFLNSLFKTSYIILVIQSAAYGPPLQISRYLIVVPKYSSYESLDCCLSFFSDNLSCVQNTNRNITS